MATFIATISGLYRDLDNNSATDPTYDGINPPSRFDFTLNTTFISENFAQPDTIVVSGDQNASFSYFGTIELSGNIFMVLAGTGGSRFVYGNAGTGFTLPDTLDISEIVQFPTNITEMKDNWSGDADSNSVNLLGGNDVGRGRAGADTINGNAGSDTLFGNNGNDHLFGGSGADVLRGEKGRDFLDGGNGNDYLNGGKGDDTLNGGTGDDEMIGGVGHDYLNGGGGRDMIDGGGGNDDLFGGGKADRFIFQGNFGDDSVLDFETKGKAEKIDLIAIASIVSMADLRNNHTTEVNGDTVINDGQGNTITLVDIALADLKANDFLFS